jgi:hypothetical protein
MITLAKPILRKPSTIKQKKQQALSWTLFTVTGSIGNLYPRDSNLPPQLRLDLMALNKQLKALEKQIRNELRNIK